MRKQAGVSWNEQIRGARKSAGLTQVELAEKVGVQPRQVQRIEAGEDFPSRVTLERLCEVLGIRIIFPASGR